MSVDLIELWHQRARPQPTERDFQTQLGIVGTDIPHVHIHLIPRKFADRDTHL